MPSRQLLGRVVCCPYVFFGLYELQFDHSRDAKAPMEQVRIFLL